MTSTSSPLTSPMARAGSVPAVARDRWPGARRALTLALAALWLLDAALQFQPFMFTHAFPATVLEPAGHGGPGWVSGPVHWAAALLAGHLIVLNTLFALVQLGLAVGLAWPRTVRPALGASIAWALLVWWLGEGLGGVLGGPVSPLMGLPGAVVLYALLALIAWPPRAARPGRSLAESSVLTAPGARVLWLVVWASFAFESLRPVDRAPNFLHDMITGMSDGQPGWLAAIDTAAGDALTGRGTVVSVALAVVFAVTALAIVLPAPAARSALALSVLVSAAIWVVGENFGGIFTGQGTDPNTGPVLVLLALAYWPLRRPAADGTRARMGRRV